MKLRPYQLTALRKFEQSKEKACLIVAPTGAGKGTMATELMARAARARRKAVFLVHRREIVHDIERRLEARGVPTIRSLYSNAYVRVVSVQSLLRADIQPIDLLVVDEAHHYAADEWQDVVHRIKCRRIAGFTATPQRSDGRPLGDMFTEIIDTVSYRQLTREGILVPARALRPKQTLGNDLAKDPVEAYLKYARGQSALVFVRRVADADSVRDELVSKGIKAASVHAHTKKDHRDKIMADFAAGKIKVVANVGTLTEGVDVPHVTTCILARPCAHASTYVQIVGRVLRSAPGKTMATVIDLVGASHVHGLPGANLAYSLEGHGLDVREPQPRENSHSGPSGPHREQDILDVDLETVHTYTKETLATPETVLQKRATGEPARTVREHGRKAYAPVNRKAPAEITRGLLSKEPTGHYKLIWHEYGHRKTLGLCTRDKAAAEQTLKTFREKGVDATREEVLARKRTGLSIWKHRQAGWYYLTTWNEDLSRKVKYPLNTRDKKHAERMAEVLRAGDRARFERMCLEGAGEREAEANRLRAQANAVRARKRNQYQEYVAAE